jgi:hypothetical protein
VLINIQAPADLPTTGWGYRRAFPIITMTNQSLVNVLTAKGPRTSMEMSNALMCSTIDSIAEWGFGYYTKAVGTLAYSHRHDMVEVRLGFDCPS